MTRRISILLTALAFVTAGCGSDAPTTDATQAANPQVAAVANSDSPLEQLFGVPLFDDDAMNAWFRDLDREAQRLTAECMLAEGFDFTPQAPSMGTGPAATLATKSRDYAQQHGFGIVAAFSAAEYDPTVDYTTANSAYVASLTDKERDAYYTALQGGPQPDGFDEGFLESEGCRGEANTQVFAIVAVMEDVLPLVESHYEQFLADSRTIALSADWQRCMSEAGFPAEDPDELRNRVFVGLDEIASKDSAFEPTELPPDLPEAPQVFAGDVYSLHPKLTSAAQAELDDLAATEVAAAVANWDCREPILEDELAVQREYEAGMVAEIGPDVRASLGES